MAPDENHLLSGIVFRRLDGPDECSTAQWMLGTGSRAYRSPRLTGGEVWYGLWNLTAANGAALTATAATLRMSARILEVRAMVASAGVHWPALWGRLARELADACRAHGEEWMVAGTAGTDATAVHLLRRAGFDTQPTLRLPDSSSVVWLGREV